MNQLPRIFGYRKQRPQLHQQESNEMNKKTRRKQPKLDRRNAAKHFDYEPGSSSLESSGSDSLLYTRSLDINDRTSFPIEGVEGEFELICLSLGLSGPEDFSIPPAQWEAMKFRSSSDILPSLNLTDFDEEAKQNDEIGSVIQTQDTLPIRDFNDECLPAETTGYRNGIKGIRPPMLKPPPGARVSVVDDDTCSTWDLLRDFAPKEEEDEEKEIDGGVMSKRQEEEIVGEFSRSCSFTTSNEDDSSRSNSISPVDRFKRVITPGSWQKGELLGRGSFGSVYEGISEDGFFFAVKEVSLLDQGSQGKQSVYQLEQEIELLSQFEHENIVQYIGTEMDEKKLYIFLELITKGSLANLYRRYDLRDSQVSAYTRQILHGLKYLHDRNYVHRDIKCANILVDANGSVKLADFGLAKAIKLNDVKSCKGTAFWMAPEVVKGKHKGYGLPADIWSLGCTVLEMLTGKFPYHPLEFMQAVYRIGKGEPPPVPDSLSSDARDFILQCLKVNPDERPTAAQLINHTFVQRSFSQSSGSASPYIPREVKLVISNYET